MFFLSLGIVLEEIIMLMQGIMRKRKFVVKIELILRVICTLTQLKSFSQQKKEWFRSVSFQFKCYLFSSYGLNNKIILIRD